MKQTTKNILGVGAIVLHRSNFILHNFDLIRFFHYPRRKNGGGP